MSITSILWVSCFFAGTQKVRKSPVLFTKVTFTCNGVTITTVTGTFYKVLLKLVTFASTVRLQEFRYERFGELLLPGDGPWPPNTECWYCDIDEVLAGTDELRELDVCQLGVVERPVMTELTVVDVTVDRTGCDDVALIICCWYWSGTCSDKQHLLYSFLSG